MLLFFFSWWINKREKKIQDRLMGYQNGIVTSWSACQTSVKCGNEGEKRLKANSMIQALNARRPGNDPTASQDQDPQQTERERER